MGITTDTSGVHGEDGFNLAPHKCYFPFHSSTVFFKLPFVLFLSNVVKKIIYIQGWRSGSIAKALAVHEALSLDPQHPC